MASSEKDNGRSYPGPPLDPTNFLWMMTEEPHCYCQTAIMKAHPEVTKLMGHKPLTKYIILGIMLLQVSIAIYLHHTHPLSWVFLAMAYVMGGTANHNIFLAIHEIMHNLAFRGMSALKQGTHCLCRPLSQLLA
ncbi:hypothetical protein EDC04DRAFT_2561132 [Pisolithus marmoratus]|nr:hypothetical protein EDC04DRAFT_2561132 [Pisolithus marmoratus]